MPRLSQTAQAEELRIARRFKRRDDVLAKMYMQVGKQLAMARKMRHYKAIHVDFRYYCRDVWGISDARASQLIRLWRDGESREGRVNG